MTDLINEFIAGGLATRAAPEFERALRKINLAQYPGDFERKLRPLIKTKLEQCKMQRKGRRCVGRNADD